MAIERERAERAVASVPDPELPMVSLAELGMIRDVTIDGATVRVALTPTYSGCPALHEMRADIVRRLGQEGFLDVEVRLVLSPRWTTDWITPEGRRKLHEAGIAPPGRAPERAGPVPLMLGSSAPVACPHCGSSDTVRTAMFAATACRSLHRCRTCAEPFEHVKAI